MPFFFMRGIKGQYVMVVPEKDLILVQSNNAKVHLVGGLNIGRDFEITAVPDIRNDANLVAQKIFLNI